MKPQIGAILFVVSVGWLWWNRSEPTARPETLVMGYDESAVDAARARALAEVDTFIAELEKRNGSDFGVKAPITDAGNTEHFWLTDVEYRDGKFVGKIGNEPGIVQNVKFGQEWTVSKSEIDDWMFMRDGKIHGNYTLRPLLKRLPPERAAQIRAMLAEP